MKMIGMCSFCGGVVAVMETHPTIPFCQRCGYVQTTYSGEVPAVPAPSHGNAEWRCATPDDCSDGAEFLCVPGCVD